MKKSKKWVLSEVYSDETAEKIAREMKLPLLPSKVLAARGVGDYESAVRYLDKSPDNLFDPMLLPDIRKAVEIIRDALSKNEKIAIYGDYDVDGVTSTCILLKYLRKQGANCVYYIPDRLNEGYGLSTIAIDKLAQAGVGLIITVDTGITAINEVAHARSLGLRIVVTDHHECKEVIPDAHAVVNPKRPDSEYPFKDLAGVGVAFKLVCALAGPERFEEIFCEYATLTAIGTIADLMPLVSENRALAYFGLRMIDADVSPGYRALAKQCDLDERRRSSAISISYVIAPRVNAAGRFGCAEKAVELFLTEDAATANVLAGELCELNRMRQDLENQIRDEAMEKYTQECREEDRAVVLWNENWHHGVIGIVTSKLADVLGKPVILLCAEGEEARGSGRSVDGFNLFAALQHNASHILKFGGHELASGLTVKTENLELFRAAFIAYANHVLGSGECIPAIHVDCMANPEDFTLHSVDSLSELEPFGMANPQPLFCMRDLRVICHTSIGNDRHTRLILAAGSYRFDAVHFGASVSEAPYTKGSLVDIIFCADINTFRERSIQFIIRDICLNQSGQQCNQRDIQAFSSFIAGEDLDPQQANHIAPNRNEQIAVWKYITANSRDQKYSGPPEDAALRIRTETGVSINPGKLLICCSVFAEASLIQFTYDNEVIRVKIAENTAKRDISGSRIIARLKELASQQ